MKVRLIEKTMNDLGLDEIDYHGWLLRFYNEELFM
jgi:hypothetical protein